MNRKERLLKLLREELLISEKELIDYPPLGDDDHFAMLVKNARRIAETIRILEEEL